MPRVKAIAPVPDPPRYYTMPEAAAIARRSVSAMRNLRLKNQGPRFEKVDGRLVVSEDELRRWLQGPGD